MFRAIASIAQGNRIADIVYQKGSEAPLRRLVEPYLLEKSRYAPHSAHPPGDFCTSQVRVKSSLESISASCMGQRVEPHRATLWANSTAP